MGYSITCLGTFCMLLRRSGKNIPGASGCIHRSFSSFPSGRLCPYVPSSRQNIRPSSFNASETFTAFRLIRDVLTFFVWGLQSAEAAPAFSLGCVDMMGT